MNTRLSANLKQRVHTDFFDSRLSKVECMETYRINRLQFQDAIEDAEKVEPRKPLRQIVCEILEDNHGKVNSDEHKRLKITKACLRQCVKRIMSRGADRE